MRLELACFDKAASYEDLMKTGFAASRKLFDCVCVPAGLVSKIREYVVGPHVSAVVDYPHGTEVTEVRIASIVNAFRRGATRIDLVVNNVDLYSNYYDKVVKDARICKDLCEDKGLDLRLILEHSLFDSRRIINIAKRLVDAGIESVVTSTCSINDDSLDSLSTAMLIKKETPLNVIVAVNFLGPEIYSLCSENGIDSLRITSYRNIFLEIVK